MVEFTLISTINTGDIIKIYEGANVNQLWAVVEIIEPHFNGDGILESARVKILRQGSANFRIASTPVVRFTDDIKYGDVIKVEQQRAPALSKLEASVTSRAEIDALCDAAYNFACKYDEGRVTITSLMEYLKDKGLITSKGEFVRRRVRRWLSDDHRFELSQKYVKGVSLAQARQRLQLKRGTIVELENEEPMVSPSNGERLVDMTKLYAGIALILDSGVLGNIIQINKLNEDYDDN